MTFKNYDQINRILITKHYPAGDPRLKKAWEPKPRRQRGKVSRKHTINIIQR